MRQEAESKAEPVGKIGFSKLHNEIRFRDVCFEYNDGTVALRNINIDIPQGSVVSIVGPSGAGKSTIIDLIAGLINPTSGEVSIDGANLGTFNQFSWRQQVSYLTQEPFLFNDTVENNIAWASREPN
jgi:ABC-type multidrug transport system fused ATPase/permease subunit